MKAISNYLFGDQDFARWQNNWMLWFILLALVFIGVYSLNRFQQKKQLSQFKSEAALKNVLPNLSKNRSIFRFVLWTVGFCVIILSAANLQFGDKKEEVKRAGIDLMLCLDVSKSMLAEDLKPNRLTRAKLAINKIINSLGSDKIGVIVFAGDAFLQLPLTNDHSAAELFIQSINTGIIPVPGTNIASALELAKKSFPESSPTNKAIVVITDGEEHDGKAIQIAESLEEEKIKVFTIGLGSAVGTTIPNFKNGRRIGVKKDKKGSTVITRLNEPALVALANAGGGTYVRGSNQSLGLQTMLNTIGEIEKTEYEAKEYTSYTSRYQWFLALGILFILMDVLILKRKGTWLRST
ncbi:MAG: vWA domain-containing protein [Flavobacteriales bacterium]